MGKTSQILWIVPEMGGISDMSLLFFSIVFKERSFEISIAGEFLPGCLKLLAEQTLDEESVSILHSRHNEMGAISSVIVPMLSDAEQPFGIKASARSAVVSFPLDSACAGRRNCNLLRK